MEKESIFESKIFASKLEHDPFSMCFLTIFLRSIFIFSIKSFACPHVILLYVNISYNCLWHSLMTSDLSALIGPRFLSVSLTQTLTFLFFINIKRFFSLLDRFCFSVMSFSKRILIASLTFRQKIMNCHILRKETKLFLRRKNLFFSKTPGFDCEKNT